MQERDSNPQLFGNEPNLLPFALSCYNAIVPWPKDLSNSNTHTI
ncbi:hypothetical protein BN174_3920005 [Clostridioides difficile E15]|nr:hypothetical protein BN174_3920005 [Clostridioides difficile E15]